MRLWGLHQAVRVFLLLDKCMDQDDEPRSLLCPISHEIMKDPVIVLQSNQTLSRSSAVQWFLTGKRRCPVSGCALATPTLVPNQALASLIKSWREGDETQVVKAFTCPVTKEIMRDPVVVVWSLQTISRAAADAWIESGDECCPVTKKRLNDRSIIPNIALRNALDEWEGGGSFLQFGASRIPCGNVSQEPSKEHDKLASKPTVISFAPQTTEPRSIVPSRVAFLLCCVILFLVSTAVLVARFVATVERSDDFTREDHGPSYDIAKDHQLSRG